MPEFLIGTPKGIPSSLACIRARYCRDNEAFKGVAGCRDKLCRTQPPRSGQHSRVPSRSEIPGGVSRRKRRQAEEDDVRIAGQRSLLNQGSVGGVQLQDLLKSLPRPVRSLA